MFLPLATAAFAAQPIIWDDDQDGLDDRMETVNLLGVRYAHEDDDASKPLRFQVSQSGTDLVYGVYLVFNAPPTSTQLLQVALLGMPVLHHFEGVPAVRTVATFAQATAALSVQGLDHVEVVPIAYGLGIEDAASLGARDASNQVFPNWSGSGGADGSGEVVAILDSGINDAPEGGWPGHESLLGRVIGGAQFVYGDSILDTSRDGSMNPSDHGGSATGAHGTHVAGLILGTGGESGYAEGIAPGARAIDVKVITDAGVGTGVAEALDWCIHNRSRDWGAGSAYTGIDVINLSLSSLDQSDGNDVVSKLAARAVELGISVVASMGNKGLAQHVPSPASGDGVLAIGAYDAQRTGAAADDQYATFNNAGPRASDADGDPGDEQKPDLLAPGVAVLSADGDLSTDGHQYVRKTGTSMAAAALSGAVAVLRSEFPSLSPADIATLLRVTARRDLGGVPVGSGGVDPRWQSARGWGAADLYAARLERLQPGRSQVRRLIVGSDAGAMTATIWTMRERGAPRYVLERADDDGGSPGTFAGVDSAAAAGDSSLASGNLHTYSFSRPIAPPERGNSYWYRVAFTEAGVRTATAARRVTLSSGPAVARIEFRIVHNAYDHDLGGAIVVGDGSAFSGSGPPGYGLASPTIPLPGTTASVASDWVSGISTLGNIAWDFALDVPAGFAPGFTPPSQQSPWFLRVTDGGYLNRSGRIDSFRLVWHATSGDLVFEGGPVPSQTLEGGTVEVRVPAAVTGVGPQSFASGLKVGPNPVRSGQAVTWSGSALLGADLDIFDLTGRRVARLASAAGGPEMRWEARDSQGRPLPAGLYLARSGRDVARLVVLGR